MNNFPNATIIRNNKSRTFINGGDTKRASTRQTPTILKGPLKTSYGPQTIGLDHNKLRSHGMCIKPDGAILGVAYIAGGIGSIKLLPCVTTINIAMANVDVTIASPNNRSVTACSRNAIAMSCATSSFSVLIATHWCHHCKDRISRHSSCLFNCHLFAANQAVDSTH